MKFFRNSQIKKKSMLCVLDKKIYIKEKHPEILKFIKKMNDY